jgi:hypothetical protein
MNDERLIRLAIRKLDLASRAELEHVVRCGNCETSSAIDGGPDWCDMFDRMFRGSVPAVFDRMFRGSVPAVVRAGGPIPNAWRDEIMRQLGLH